MLDNGFTVDSFEAVLAVAPGRPLDFMQRLDAVRDFRALPEAEALAAANKRIDNILRKNGAYDQQLSLQTELLNEQAEQNLAVLVSEVQQAVTPLMQQADYPAVLKRLATMRDSIDKFFDDVMVMADEPAVRDNRLALLNQTRALFIGVADISCLQQ